MAEAMIGWPELEAAIDAVFTGPDEEAAAYFEWAGIDKAAIDRLALEMAKGTLEAVRQLGFNLGGDSGAVGERLVNSNLMAVEIVLRAMRARE